MSSRSASVSMRWLRSTESRGSANAAVAAVIPKTVHSRTKSRLVDISYSFSEGEVEPRTDPKIPVVPDRNVGRPGLVQHRGRERQIAREIILQTDIRRIELVLPS
jgi:hypothetical protein